MTPARVAISVAALVLLGGGARAWAHERSASYAVWRVDEAGGAVALKLRARDREVLRAAIGALAVDDMLPRWLGLRAAGQPCSRVGPVRELAAEPGWARYEWRVACAVPAEVEARGLLSTIPGHLHMVEVARGTERSAGALTASSPALGLGNAAPGGASPGVARFVWLGFDHILRGVDHLLFVFALLVAAARWRDAALAITGFTIGHSATLALVALDLVAPRVAPVEAVVGLSIALVAIDNLWLAGGRRDVVLPAASVVLCLAPIALGAEVPAFALIGLAVFAGCQLRLLALAHRPERVRLGAAALFGLVHGLAFAGGLRALTGAVGLGELVGFNLGVELGQVAAIALLWPLLALVRRGLGRGSVCRFGSSLAVAAGLAWFVVRA